MPHVITTLADLGSVFGLDGIVVLVLGLLICGCKLPEVPRNIRRFTVEMIGESRDREKLFLILLAIGLLILMMLTLWAKMSPY